jgi:hypothetical protein
MSEKEIFILTDPFTEPTEEFLQQVLAEKYEWWKTIRKYTTENHQNVTEVWKYYNDAKQWLFRMKNKKDTICWVGILADTFRITFYFGSKCEMLIEESDLPEPIKEGYRQTHEQKFRPISILMSDLSDVVIACKLVDLKFAKL